MDSDEDLLLQFQRGSHASLEELFARYRRALYSFYARRLSNSQRADDLVQDTFIALIKGTTHYEPRSPVRTYLFGVAFNILFAERRRVQRAAGSVDVESVPQRAGGSLERALWVRQALLKLENGDREILMLREYEELSYGEISTLLRIPINTVRSRLFRSRLAMKQLLMPIENVTAEEGGV